MDWAWLCLQGPAEPETLAKQDQPGSTLGHQPPCELWMQPWVGRGLLFFPEDALESRPDGDCPGGLPLVVQTREARSRGCYNSECQVWALPSNGRLCKVLFTKSVKRSFRAHAEGTAEIIPHPVFPEAAVAADPVSCVVWGGRMALPLCLGCRLGLLEEQGSRFLRL